MISIALTFGAPVTVPAGKQDRRTSKASSPSLRSPSTFETRCITWLYLSTFISSVTFTEPVPATLPTSFLPRSTSMICSAISFGSFLSSSSRDLSSFSVSPLFLVPAIGLRTIFFPSSLTSISGDDPTIFASPASI